jgi:hypothetical protein
MNNVVWAGLTNSTFGEYEHDILWEGRAKVLRNANALPIPVQSSAATWTSMGKSAQEKMRAHGGLLTGHRARCRLYGSG